MQRYTVTLWDSKHETATGHSLSFPLHATDEDRIGLAEGINLMLSTAAEAGAPRWLSIGANYKGRHNAKGWRDANCLVLEWDAQSDSSVIAALQRMNLHAIILSTSEGKNDKKNRITAIVPCDALIDSSRDYSRLASLLVSDIKAVALTGGDACTFFVHAQAGAEALEIEAANIFSPNDELDRTDFVKVADFKGEVAA